MQHQDIQLTKEELEIIKKLQRSAFPDEEYDPYPKSVDFFTQDVMQMPLSAAPEPKRRFVPSKWEHKRVMQIVRAIRKGLIVPRKPKSTHQVAYNLWNDEEDKEREPHPMHIPAPKMKLPDHAESYNPPSEFLLTKEEEAEWNGMDREDRMRNFLPSKYPNLRAVPGYSRFINERFGRCLDLYLCPRTVKKRVVDPESLLPDLPDPKELEPFPKMNTITYSGHTGRVRSISVDPTGQWLVSGSDDKTLRLWEVCSGRCLRQWTMEETIMSVSWNPNKNFSVFAVARYEI